jgi:hypothetical protein
MLIKSTEPSIMASNPENGPLDKKFEKLVKETLGTWHVPGVSVAVVDGENTYAQVISLQSMLPMLIFSQSGLRYRICRGLYPYDTFYTLLRRKHHKGIYSGGNVASSR